jgi:CRISPR-associated protein Csa3
VLLWLIYDISDNALRTKTSEDAIKLGVRKMANLDRVVLIAGKPLIEVFEASEIKKDKLLVDPVKKALELKKLLEDLGIEVEIHNLID